MSVDDPRGGALALSFLNYTSKKPALSTVLAVTGRAFDRFRELF